MRSEHIEGSSQKSLLGRQSKLNWTFVIKKPYLSVFPITLSVCINLYLQLQFCLFLLSKLN